MANGPASPNGPQRTRPATPPTPRPTKPLESDLFDDELDELDDVTPRWVALLTTLGLALVAVVAAQVVTSIIEGVMITEARNEPRGVPTDLLHRLGFPFGNLGPTAMLLLVVGLALICIPTVLDHENTPLLERLATVALVTIILLAVVVAIGSLLAVRYSLHEYTAQGQDPPAFIRVGFASFLLGTLGTAAAALFGSLAALSVRARRRRQAS